MFLFTFAVLIFSLHAQSQAAKSVFIELGGPGLASLNFDIRCTKSQDGIGGRAGIGGFSLSLSTSSTNSRATVIFIPLGLNYLIGKNTQNYFEFGAGYTPVITNTSSGSSNSNFSTSFGHLNIGYRYQPLKSGVTFRAFITPVFGDFGFLPYYGGVSFGYKF